MQTKSQGGRVFILGLGGSSANAAHLCADLRTLCGMDARSLTDHTQITAKANDLGWNYVYHSWLSDQMIGTKDLVLFLSVGGGDFSKNVSIPLIQAARFAISNGSKVISITGRSGSELEKLSDLALVLFKGESQKETPEFLTPHSESMMLMLGHLICSHPELITRKPLWESMQNPEYPQGLTQGGKRAIPGTHFSKA